MDHKINKWNKMKNHSLSDKQSQQGVGCVLWCEVLTVGCITYCWWGIHDVLWTCGNKNNDVEVSFTSLSWHFFPYHSSLFHQNIEKKLSQNGEILCVCIWLWLFWDSNSGPSECKAAVSGSWNNLLTMEPHFKIIKTFQNVDFSWLIVINCY